MQVSDEARRTPLLKSLDPFTPYLTPGHPIFGCLLRKADQGLFSSPWVSSCMRAHEAFQYCGIDSKSHAEACEGLYEIVEYERKDVPTPLWTLYYCNPIG